MEKVYNPRIYNMAIEAFEQAGIDPQPDLNDNWLASTERSLNLLFAEFLNLPTDPQFMLQTGYFDTTPQEPSYNLNSITRTHEDNRRVDENDDSNIYAEGGIARINEKNSSVLIKDIGDMNPTWQTTSLKNMKQFNRLPVIADARPYNVFVHQIHTPIMNFYPTPDKTYQVKFTYVMSPEAITNSLDRIDVPVYWTSAVTSGLAWKLAMKNPTISPERILYLQEQYNTNLEMVLSREGDHKRIKLTHGSYKWGGYKRRRGR